MSEPAPERRRPSHLRYSWPELLFILILSGGMLFGVTRAALGLYFKTAGIRPGVRFLGQEIGGLGKIPALERLEGIVSSGYRFPLLLELGGTTYFLYRRDHFELNIDLKVLVEQALELGRSDDIWTRARRHLKADFEPVDLPWAPTLDREYSLPRIAKLIEDHADSRVHAFLQADGTMRVVVSDTEDQVNAILDSLEETLRTQPLPGRRVLSVGNLAGSDSEYIVAPDDPDRGFRFSLATVEIPLNANDPIETANVDLAAGRLHGRILNPDEVLDFAEIAGPLTIAGGYKGRPASRVSAPSSTLPPSWVDGEPPPTQSMKPSEAATGVERVAAAIFQALLRGGASLEQRTTHRHYSKDLHYVPLGLDTRLLPEPDSPSGRLAMRNSWDFPVQLLLGLASDRVVAEVRGLQEAPATVEIRVGVPEKVPYKTELVRSPELPRGVEQVDLAGIDGFRVKIFRKLIRKDGVQAQEKMLGEKPIDYAPRASRILLGTGARIPAPPRDLGIPPSRWGGF